MAIYTLQDPGLLHLKIEGQEWYGFCQEWYEDDWRRRAGCGPTTAAYLLAYRMLRDGIWEDVNDAQAALCRMNQVWDYVTPRHGGLFKTRWMKEGIEKFLAATDIKGYNVRSLPISVLSSFRPTADQVEDFIREGLKADSPLAFLNRHRGNEAELETWHWVPLVALSDDSSPITALCYDEGEERRFVPSRWLQDSFLGGGLVYIEKAD